MSQGGIGRNVLSDLARFLIRRAHDEGLPSYPPDPLRKTKEGRFDYVRMGERRPIRVPMMVVGQAEKFDVTRPKSTPARGWDYGKPEGEKSPLGPGMLDYQMLPGLGQADIRGPKPKRQIRPEIPFANGPVGVALGRAGTEFVGERLELGSPLSVQQMVEELVEKEGMGLEQAHEMASRVVDSRRAAGRFSEPPDIAPSLDGGTLEGLQEFAKQVGRTPPPSTLVEPDIRAALKGPLAPLVPVLKGMSKEDRVVAIDNIMGNLAKKGADTSFEEVDAAGLGDVESLGKSKQMTPRNPLDYLEPAGQWTKLGPDVRPLVDKKLGHPKYAGHQAVVQHQLNPLLEKGTGLLNPAYDVVDVKKAVAPLEQMHSELLKGTSSKDWSRRETWKADRFNSLIRKLRGADPEITRAVPEMVPRLYNAWLKRNVDQVHGTESRVGLFEHAEKWAGDPKIKAKAKEALEVWKKAADRNDPVAMGLAAESAYKFLGKPAWNDRETVRPVSEGDLPWANHALETAKHQAGLTGAEPGSSRWKTAFNQGAMERMEEWERSKVSKFAEHEVDPSLEKHDPNWTEPAKVKDAVRAYAQPSTLNPTYTNLEGDRVPLSVPRTSTKKMYAIKVLSMGQERKGLPPSWHQKTPDEWALNETLKGIKSLSSIKQQAAQGDSVARVLGQVLGAVEERGSAGWALRQATRGMQPGMIERVEKIVQTLIRHAQ